MNWYIISAVVIFFIVLSVTRALGNLKEEDALQYLEAGAVVIDVRSEAEFADKSIDGVINIPLPVLAEQIADTTPDKDQIILLHCRSGNRSAQGMKILRSMGYEKVYNLGSYGHAAKILGKREVVTE